MNTQTVILDVDKRYDPSQVVTIGQGDKSGTTIVAEVYDKGVSVSLGGYTAEFEMRLPDGRNYVRDNDCTVSGNTITYVVDEEHCGAAAGHTNECYFNIKSGSSVIYSTSRFRMDVLRSAHDGAVPAASWDSNIEEWLENASDELDSYVSNADATINAAVEQMRSDVADAIEDTDDVIERADAAIDAMGDISELAVPLMSSDTRGGAKLGDGLAVDDGTLHVGQLAKASTGEVYGPLASVTAKGHAEQFSTTGKNLLPNMATSQTINGVTFTVNADGSVTCNGTASASAILNVCPNGGISLASGTYKLSGCPSGGSASTYLIGWDTHGYDTGTGLVATIADVDTHGVNIAIGSGVTCNNLTFYPQLELGSTATEYEPYTGGAPSPSPDYPQEIQVVRGRNLIDESKSSLNKLVYASDGHEIYFNGIAHTEYIKVEANTDYYVINGIGGGSQNTGAIYDANKQYLRGLGITGAGSQSTVINTGANAAYVVMNYYMPSRNEYVGPPQLSLGSTPQPYVPYGHVWLEVKTVNLSKTISDAWRVGGLNSNTDAESSANNRMSTTEAYKIPVAIGSICKLSVNSSYKAQLYQYEANGTYITNGTFAVESTIVLNANTAYVKVLLGRQNDANMSFSADISAANVRLFNIISTPIPLPQRGWVGGLPDGTSDVLSIDSAGKVEWEKKTEEVVLDGSSDESWGTSETPLSDQLCAYVTCRSIGVYAKIPSTFTEIVSTHFRALRAGAGATAGNTNCVSFNGNSGNLLTNIDKTIASTLADFKTWLQSHTVTVLYPLATPVTEDCGYVDLPDIPSEATVSIPELEELGLTFWVDEDGTIRAAMREWYERAHSDMTLTESQVDAAVAAAFA